MILTLPSYERAFGRLTDQQQEGVQAALSVLENALGNPHTHSGIGIRRFGKFLEARAGLDLRILLVSREADIILVTVGSHDDLQAYIKNNPKPKV
jgi:hypothetical protein